MRITKLTLKAFRGISDKLELPIGGHNMLIYGENGSSKSSLARALELLFDPRDTCALEPHRNLFTTSVPSIIAEFEGHVTNIRPSDGKKFPKKKMEKVEWTAGSAKPLPAWLLSSSARSAFLDHRKLLLLSDRERDLSESFFLTAVQHLFAYLTAGTTNKRLSVLWAEIQDGVKTYNKARQQRGQSAETGTLDPVAHYKPIEDAINTLNAALDEYLLPQGKKPTPLVAEAQRLLGMFENLQLQIALEFEHLTFNRHDGTLSGGLLHPHVTFCKKELGAAVNGGWVASHQHVLNEARLTALALALFFAAVRLQDQIQYVPGATDPEQPARLLVLDDVLVGLDYDHRIPVLKILRAEFLKAKRFQLVLLTHNREWFDYCRLKMGQRQWTSAEIYAKREAGPENSDYPMRKESSSNLVKRARDFLDVEHELPAAANYARTAIEWALKELCAQKHLPIPFNLEPYKHDTDEFLAALTGRRTGRKSRRKIVRKDLQTDLEALRKTVLNAYSHWHPTTAVESDIRQAIAVAEKLVKLAQSA